MKTAALIFTNLALVACFIHLMRKRDFLSYFQNGRWWLTWLAIAIITLMDELTSIYYAPFEAYRFIGMRAIVYIGITSLFFAFMSTRMVEIAEILEVNNIRGGGVYSFSYMILGPSASFIAAASILVVYVLTAAMSTVSAVQNGTTFVSMTPQAKYALAFVVVWGIAGLNILGIRESAKFTFVFFVAGAIVLVNLMVGGLFSLSSESVGHIREGVRLTVDDIRGQSFFAAYGNIIAGLGACVLTYSGIESVLQTASLARSWRDIGKAYLFLALTVGIFTPVIALLALSSTPNLDTHTTDLIPAFAQLTNGRVFGIAVSILASLTLIMAVNTAMVASAELIEKIAEKYSYSWIVKLNRRQSLYRVHIFNAIFYTLIIIATSGSQALLAQMYAVGLIASFSINILSLILYKYAKGTKEITFNTSRIGTVCIFILLVSIFIYIAFNRLYGTALWLTMAGIFLFAGLRIAKRRAPEISVRRATHTPMDIVFAIVAMPADDVHVHFTRPKENATRSETNSIEVSFYSPRIQRAEKDVPNRFWISIQERTGLFEMILGLLETISYDVPSEKRVHIHFGWPLSSWLDRLSMGVMVHSFIHLPKQFPDFCFHIDYQGSDR